MFVSPLGLPPDTWLLMDLTHGHASSGLSHRHDCVSWALSEHSTMSSQHPILQGSVPWWASLGNAGLDTYFSSLAI